MAGIPSHRRVNVGASVITEAILIPAGATRLLINPLTSTTDVQGAFNTQDANTTGRFFSLLDGQALELTVNAGDAFPALTLTFFATTAVDLDLLWW